jgi:ATP-dependent Clp protease ATP-binding subunit ClpC
MVELENTDNLILFIDELHTLVGAGGASGSLDASNMFKPALARGDIHCIGATTLDEYRKHIEKDGALERRFQKIIVNPPSQDETVRILMGLKEAYENHHNVRYDDSAIEACVYLSDRYITDKFLPDKAIDIMDEAGSRAHLHNVSVPQKIIDLEKEIDKVRTRKEEVVAAQNFEDAAKHRDKEQKLLIKLSKFQQEWQEHEHSKPELISEETIADVVALVSGIPVNKVAESETNKLLKMKDVLQKNIIGQKHAVTSISKSIQRARAGLKNPNRPIGVFLFLGPTGVGKTELAKVLANYLFSQTGSIVKIDMSEFSERFSISRLIGAPPGYVGYEEGGELTEKVRRNPYSVVLFDEMEKAHPDVYNLLLQLFDEGVLTDNLSRKVDFKNTIIILTSNVGTKEIVKGSTLGFVDQSSDQSYEAMRDKLLDRIKTTFSPEFLNRIDETIVFHSLSEEHVLDIINLQLEDLRTNLQRKGIKIRLTKSALKLLVKKGFNPEYGARHLRREIQNSLEDPISEMLLEEKYVERDTIKVNAKKNVFLYTKAPIKKDKSKKSTPSIDSTEEVKSP